MPLGTVIAIYGMGHVCCSFRQKLISLKIKKQNRTKLRSNPQQLDSAQFLFSLHPRRPAQVIKHDISAFKGLFQVDYTLI